MNAVDRPACPRCGARMGALDAADGSPASHYCGCCGLVMPAAHAPRPTPHAP